MSLLTDLLEYQFLSNAFWACIACGVACGIIGTYVVCRRLVFLSGGITHASFGGIGMAYYFGFNPIAGALVFAIISALGIETLSCKRQLREDSAIGLLWSLGMAIGIIFIYLTPGYAPNLMSFLFGNILSVTTSDLLWMGVVDLLILLCFTLLYRPILYVSFDREYARTQRLPTQLVSYLLSALVAATIVISIRVVGIVLLISLLTIPALIASTLSRPNFAQMMGWATLFAVGGSIVGLIISYQSNIPSGASTIFTLTLTLIGVKLLSLYGEKLARRRKVR